MLEMLTALLVEFEKENALPKYPFAQVVNRLKSLHGFQQQKAAVQLLNLLLNWFHKWLHKFIYYKRPPKIDVKELLHVEVNC